MLPRVGQGAHRQGADPVPRALRAGQRGRDVRDLHARRHQPRPAVGADVDHLARSIHDHGLQRHRAAAPRQRRGAAVHAVAQDLHRQPGLRRGAPPHLHRRGQVARPRGSGRGRRHGVAGVSECRGLLDEGGQERTPAFPEVWSEEFAHYLGWLIGDGSTSGTTVASIYGSQEDRDEILPRHAELLERINWRSPDQAFRAGQRHGPAAPGPASVQALHGGLGIRAGQGTREDGAVVDRAGAGRDGGGVPARALRRRRVRGDRRWEQLRRLGLVVAASCCEACRHSSVRSAS